MKKHFLIALLFLCCIFVVPISAQEYIEYISEFNSEIVINEDASIDIVEEVHYHLPEGRHGIYWTLPVDYLVSGFMRKTGFDLNDLYYYPASDSSLVKTSYTKTVSSGWVELKIGEADTTISGEYVYFIDYTLRDVGVSYFDDHDEIYLNIIGPGWQVPILKSTATITTPVSDTDRICYTGIEGEVASDCTITDSDDGVVISTDTILEPYSAFTMALAFPVGTIENHESSIWLGYLIANLGILLPIPVIIFLVKKLKKKWQNKKITIIPHYDAPKGLDPMLAGYVYMKKYNSKHLTALIIWMAVQGYISIEREEEKTYLNKEKKSIVGEKEYIVKLFESMFSKEDRVMVSNMPTSFVNRITSIVSLVNTQTRSEGYIDKERVNKKGVLSILGIILVGFSLFVLLPILTIYAAVGTGWGLIISGVAMVIVSSKIDIRSIEGNKLYYQLLGLKMYINTAEKHRIEFHNDPKKFRGVFETLLPYAIIFGLEQKWAEEFKDLYKDTQPDWYRGDFNTFTPYLISRSISSLNSGIRTSSTKAYGSSSGYRSSGWSSGGSGFSGGSSGGGGGGSGGSSW